MRRKSERTASKKTKSPEKKIEKVKRTRTRRRKQSSSSENESAEEAVPVKQEEKVEVEKKPPSTPVKEDSPEEAHDQVWQVKTTEASGDVGEIQKLKICLTRPPSTPERVDRSPRSKRKHSRATSSSDTPSNEGEEKKKSKHRSKRAARESKDDYDKNHDSQEEPEAETESRHSRDKSDNEISQSSVKKSDTVPDDTPMSTTNEEAKSSDSVDQSRASTNEDVSKNKEEKASKGSDAEPSKTSDADTTVASPRAETTVVSTDSEAAEVQESKSTEEKVVEHSIDTSEDKSEVLELHDEDNRCESSDTEVSKSQTETQDRKSTDSKQDSKAKDTKKAESSNDSKQEKKAEDSQEKAKSEAKDQETESRKDEVSKTEGKNEDKTDSSKEKPHDSNESNKHDESHVVENSEKKDDKVRKVSESGKDAEEHSETRRMERSDSTQSQHEDSQNGTSAPIVISRKRRWGSRPSKIQTQKSITISTDVLKDIIPDVKPVEFDEVIEDKKSKREVTEKIERPVLPKIVIDNTESIELNKKVTEEKERDIVKPRDSHLTSNRKISIVKENDSIIARPPSPPRHKQSCILFITNLVRPFTLPQLKNLLQRTGRLVEDGFWIDRIKSKCYVKYETEDQAVETRHALHGVTWPVSNPKTLQVDFSNDEAFGKAKLNEDTDNAQVSTIPGTVEDWLREQDIKRERGEMEKPFERKTAMREWDVGKNEKDKEKNIRGRLDERPIGLDKRRHRSQERSPEPARKFKKKEEEAPAKLLDDLFRKTKTTPCIYWLPLSAETIAVKEEQRRQHMAEHERRLQELRRTHRRH